MEERKTEGHIMRIAKLSVALFVLGSAIVGAEESQLAKPTPVQYAWHEQERIMFVCLDPATWQGGEYDNHTTKLSDMKLGKLDVDQWMAVAESWGAKEILLVCKHTGGFCWWPTETTDYSVKNIAWKDGKGNLVKEVADACRRHGLKMGVYIYPDDPRYSKGAGGGGRTGDPNKQEEWNRLLRKQWEEVLTMCGTDLVNEIWFDGNCIVPLTDILQRLAPNAVVLQSPVASIRWVGNENGLAQDPNWNTVSGEKLRGGVTTERHSTPDGDAWAPVECDTTLYIHNWFWSPQKEKRRRSLPQLMNIFTRSAGYGSVLLLNSSPNTNGVIPEGDVKCYREFGAMIDKQFGHPVAVVENKTGNTIELEIPAGKTVTCSDLWEDYRQGHRIRAYVIEGQVDGKWSELRQGTAVGRRKLDFFEESRAAKVRVRVTESVGIPLIRRWAVHLTDRELFQGNSRPETWELAATINVKAGTQTVDVDLSKQVTTPRQYEIRVEGAGVKSAIPLFENQVGEQWFLEKIGWKGKFNLNRTQAVDKGSTTGIRLTFKTQKDVVVRVFVCPR
jgi:alpha-L-fucosidase